MGALGLLSNDCRVSMGTTVSINVERQLISDLHLILAEAVFRRHIRAGLVDFGGELQNPPSLTVEVVI